MRCTYVAGHTLSLLILISNVAAQPANNDCSAAIPLGALPATTLGTTAGATGTDITLNCGSSDVRDVWYSFVPPVTAVYQVDTEGTQLLPTPRADTTVALFDATAGCGGPLLACDDDAGTGPNSRVFKVLTAGQPILLRVASRTSSTATGNFRVNVAQAPPPPANDECAGALPLVTLPLAGDNFLATTSLEITPPTLCGTEPDAGGSNDLFFTFAPTSTDNYAVSLCQPGFDAVVSVHSGCPASGANLLKCEDLDDQVDCFGEIIRSVLLNSGSTYVIRVAGNTQRNGSDERGVFNLNVAPATLYATGGFGPLSAVRRVSAGQTAVLSLQVSEGTLPSAISSVVADFSALGGPAAFALADNGVLPDAVASDGLYTGGFLVPISATPDFYLIDWTVTDVQSRSVQGQADLFVSRANDDCTGATRIGGFPFITTVDSGFTVQDAAPLVGSCAMSTTTFFTFWYRIDVGATGGSLTGTVNGGPDIDDIVVIWSGADCASLVEVACIASPEDPIVLNQALAANTTYFVQIGSQDGGAGPVDISLQFDGVIAPSDGACCSGSTCLVAAAAACNGPNQAFQGSAVACNIPASTTVPCCKADFNQSGGVSVQDIFDFLAAYFATSPQADFNQQSGVSVQDIFDYLAAYFAGCP